METIFRCEFPEKTDWKEAKKLIKFKTEIYVAAKTRKEYEKWAKKIGTKNIEVGAWPTLSKEEGYWFSGFTKKGEIDRLKEFDGLNMKIDIEPPYPGKGVKITRRIFTYLLPHIIREGRNNEYLKETITRLKGRIIISGFPLPAWITRRYGDVTELESNMEKNFITYTTLLPIPRSYIKIFARAMIKKYGKKGMFAVGCTGTGIFGGEKTYENIEQFRKDLQMMKGIGANKIVVFNIEGIMGRDDRKQWLDELEKITS